MSAAVPKQKSPSRLKRDRLRIIVYNLKKKEEMSNNDRTARIEHLQSVLVKVEHGFNEMLELKDYHIDFLKHELANLPASILTKVKEQLQPP